MISLRKVSFFIWLLVMAIACQSNQIEKVSGIIASVEEEYVPDKRVAVFSIEAVLEKNKLVLLGESNLPHVVDLLKTALHNKNVDFEDSIRILPDQNLREGIRGLINLSVANLRAEPRHSAELVTQALLGTPVTILEKKGGWYRVQTRDDYIAWVDSGGLVVFTRGDFARWRSLQKIIFLKPFGFSYSSPDVNAQTVSDLVKGNIVGYEGEVENYYKVRYPDSTLAYVSKRDAKPYDQWLAALKPSGDSLVKTAKTLMGLPYLWGGTSFKGVDCSGFTKTVYFLNGMIIPRDASQQVHTGALVDSTKNFEKLQPGDLLFFGRPATEEKPERIVHVGLWIGNNEFIHSAGSVHISSVDSAAANFDEYNYRRYLRTKRLLHQSDENLVSLTQAGLP